MGRVKRIWRFWRTYWQFSLALLACLVALPLELAGLHVAAHSVLGLAALGLVVPLLWGIIDDLRHGTYGVDILAATAIITAVVMHEYWAGIVIVLMLTGGEALEDYAERRAKSELSALLTHAPRLAHILRGRKEVDVPASEVRTGDKLVIRPGEVVPVDAEILEGTASFDESSLTGEALPQVKEMGGTILSGSVNLDGAITVRALHSAADSQYEQIIKLVRAASNSRAPFVRLADRYSIPFTVISFSIAGAAWAISGQSIRFLEVLVVATPCPLILAAPIAVISGMSRAARHGIIIKTGGSLERLATARTFAFDKTGTLTRGKLAVATVQAFTPYTQEQVLGLAASLEQKSNHVLARAIVSAAMAQGARLAKTKNVQELAGSGLRAHAGGKDVLVGRLGLMQQHSVQLPKALSTGSVQQTAAFVAIDGRLAGVITFTDDLRPEAKTTLQRLRQLGVQNFLMVTGDNRTTAQAIAKKLDIKQVVAEALPADKLHAIEHIAERPVAFVGDGVNDAPVLTASDVGIALGARGSTAASESADVVIMPDSLSHVALGTEIAKRTFYIAKQSILVGIALSIGLMLIFATGKFLPLYGAIIQEAVDLVVIFNALRVHTGRLQTTTEQ
ncbi:MAG TPA: heavy metal translocating P-type ATPase [Nevskiaceae bacterium]|nr:heavy metal translocating P-type ATPase [Nevskiaceae bacterium]